MKTASGVFRRLQGFWILLVGLAFLGPLGYLIYENIRLRPDFAELLGSNRLWRPLGNSLLLATTVTASAMVVGTALAWLVARTDLPGRRAWAVLAPLPLVIPSFVGATALIALLARGGLAESLLSPLGVSELPQLAGFWGAWLTLTLFTYPYVYLPTYARLLSLDSSKEEAARMLGRRPTSVFATVVLPSAWHAITAGSLLVFLYTLSDFGAVDLLRYETLTRSIFTNRLFDRPTSVAHALVLGLAALVVVAGERRLQRRAGDPAKEEAPRRFGQMQALGRLRWAALGGVAAFMLFSLAAPLASLGFWMMRGLVNLGRDVGVVAMDLSSLAQATLSTVLVSATAAVVCVAVVLPVAWQSIRNRSSLAKATGVLAGVNFALPGVVVALALVFWALRMPFSEQIYQSYPLLIGGYVLLFGSQANQAAQVAVTTAPVRFTEAARMLGARRIRRFVSIELLLMTPSLAAAGGIVLLSVMKELPLTLLAAPTGLSMLSSEIWDSTETLSLAQAGVESLVLVAASGLLTWLLVIRRYRFGHST